MSVIIRLQNLPWSANALNIRAYFRGLAIPDGGVHIVGGEMGDAFIAFSTDEDARQAMAMDRGKINEVQVRLLLSSRAEMQKVIESARQNSLSMQLQRSGTQASQQTAVSTPQPPVITSTSLKQALNNQQSPSTKSNDVSQKFSSLNQDNSSDSRDSRDDKDDSKNRDRKRSRSRERHRSSRSRSRERRRSRSRDRGGNRRRYRSRSRSRDRNTRNKRTTRRNSRDRSLDKMRRRNRDSRDSDNERGYRDKEFNKKDLDSINLTDDKDVEQPPIPPPNLKNVWNQPNQIPGLQNIASGYSTMNQNQIQNLNQMSGMSSNMMMGYQTQIQQQQQPVYGMYGQIPQLANKIELRNDKSINLNSNAQPAMTSGSSMAATVPIGINYPFLNIFKNQDDSNSKGSITNLQNPYSAAYNTNNSLMQKNFDSKVNFSGMFAGQPQDQNNKAGGGGGGGVYIQGNQPINRFPQQFNQIQNTNANNGTENLTKNRMGSDINFDELTGHCIKVTNMCPGTSYSDIRRFFSGLFIANNGIKMINDSSGVRIGAAFIRFVKSASKPKAFTRNGQMLKNKVVTIESVTEDEFDKAIDSFRPQRRFENRNYNDDSLNRNSPRNDSPNSMDMDEGEDTTKKNENTGDDIENSQAKGNEIEEIVEPFTVLLIKDIPPFAKEHDVMKLFSLYTITDIILIPRAESRRQNLCYVKFHRFEDAGAALKNKNNHIIGHKPITVVRCSDEDFEKVKEKLNETESIVDDAMEKDQDDRLNNENDKNDPSNKRKSDNNIAEPASSETKIPSLLNLSDLDKPKLDEERKYFLLMRNCEYRLTIEDFTNFFLDFDVKPLKIEILKNSRNLPCGECIVEVENTIDADKCIDKSNTVLGVSRRVRIEEISQEIAAEKLDDSSSSSNTGNYQRNNNFIGNNNNSFRSSNSNSMNNYSRGNNFNNNNNNNNNTRSNNYNYDRKDRKPDNFRRPNMSGGNDFVNGNNSMNSNVNSQNSSALSNTTVNQFGKPGCVVSLSNVPYKANTDDILEFFGTFDIGPQNVIRRYNDDGTPTGDARVAFKSPNEARAATQKKRNCKIFTRTIYLNVV